MHKESATLRNYSTIEKEGNAYKLSEFEQVKGDYQDKISSFSFKSYNEAVKFMQSKHNQNKVQNLVFWNIGDSSLDKGLFDKKHKFIWEASNQWNEEWEIKYAEWIETEVGVDFFSKRNISTDCADALVGLRWIFSRIHSLPVANTLSETGNIFGHFSMSKKFAKYKKADKWHDDQLFLAALSYVMDLTSTRTVIRDGYPIKIDQNSLRAGTFFITQNENGGHAKIISESNFDNPSKLPLFTYASTTPRAVRNLALEIMVDQEWPSKGAKELLAFRWPVLNGENWGLMRPENHPNYSLEEFDLELQKEFPAFITYIMYKTKGFLDPLKLVESSVLDIKGYIEQRVQIVKDGYDYCNKNKCPKDSGSFDDWSTPSRDEKLLKKYLDTDLMVSSFESLSPGLTEYWLNNLRNQFVTVDGIKINLANIKYLFENKFTSSDPNVTVRARWGIDGSESLKNWLKKISDLLINRGSKVNESAKCNSTCTPRSNEWISYNSFTIDANLNFLINQVKFYCQIITEEECQKTASTLLNQSIELNGKTQTLSEWMKIMPYFHSDPNVSINRRWGKLEINEKMVLLPHFDSINISKNELALIDFKKVLDLNTNNEIYRMKNSSERVYLSSIGEVFSVQNGMIRVGKKNNLGQLIFEDVQDLEGVLLDNTDRLISYSEIDGFGVFKKSLRESTQAFRIINNRLEFIDEFSGSSFQHKELLGMVKSNRAISFADLKRTKIFEINFPETLGLKNASKIKVIDYSYPYVLADYDDQEWALHFPLLINLEEKSIVQLNMSKTPLYQIKFGDARLLKMIVQENWNDEKPNLYAVKVNLLGKTEFHLIGNVLKSAMAKNNEIFLSVGLGNQWSNQTFNLLSFGEQIKTIKSNLSSLILINQFAYSVEGSNQANLLNLATKEEISMPENVTFEKDLVRTTDTNLLSYRFDTSYGEYYQMGNSFIINNLDREGQGKIIPQFSILSGLSQDSLVEVRWRDSFKDFMVNSGVLVSTGKNGAFWWKLDK